MIFVIGQLANDFGVVSQAVADHRAVVLELVDAISEKPLIVRMVFRIGFDRLFDPTDRVDGVDPTKREGRADYPYTARDQRNEHNLHLKVDAAEGPVQRFLAQRRPVGDAVGFQRAVVVELRAREDEPLLLGPQVSRVGAQGLHLGDGGPRVETAHADLFAVACYHRKAPIVARTVVSTQVVLLRIHRL